LFYSGAIGWAIGLVLVGGLHAFMGFVLIFNGSALRTITPVYCTLVGMLLKGNVWAIVVTCVGGLLIEATLSCGREHITQV